MEVQVSPTYLISIVATSTVLASVFGAILGLFGQVWLEKIKHKHKKEDRKEDKNNQLEIDLAVTIQSILDAIDDITVGLNGLYYDKLLYLANRYIDEGCITIKELKDFDDMHRTYQNRLNGNGFLDGESSKLHELPRVKSKPCTKEKIELLLREIMGVGRTKPSEEKAASEVQK